MPSWQNWQVCLGLDGGVRGLVAACVSAGRCGYWPGCRHVDARGGIRLFPSAEGCPCTRARREARARTCLEVPCMLASLASLCCLTRAVLFGAGEFDSLKDLLGDDAPAVTGAKDLVVAMRAKMTMLESAVAAADATRKKLHNKLIDLIGNV